MTFKIKRQHERLPISEAVTLQVDQWAALHGRVENISYGGLGLILPHRVQAGDQLVFDIAVGVGKMRLEGRVRHVTELSDGSFSVGVQWHLPSDRHAELLRSFVDEADMAA